jgi:hypothetical protein
VKNGGENAIEVARLSFVGLSVDVETRNRKPLQQPVAFEADWEIRFGPDKRFRVLYDVDLERCEVHILAIGVKEKNRLTIAGFVKGLAYLTSSSGRS